MSEPDAPRGSQTSPTGPQTSPTGPHGRIGAVAALAVAVVALTFFLDSAFPPRFEERESVAFPDTGLGPEVLPLQSASSR